MLSSVSYVCLGMCTGMCVIGRGINLGGQVLPFILFVLFQRSCYFDVLLCVLSTFIQIFGLLFPRVLVFCTTLQVLTWMLCWPVEHPVLHPGISLLTTDGSLRPENLARHLFLSILQSTLLMFPIYFTWLLISPT